MAEVRLLKGATNLGMRMSKQALDIPAGFPVVVVLEILMMTGNDRGILPQNTAVLPERQDIQSRELSRVEFVLQPAQDQSLFFYATCRGQEGSRS